MRVSKAKVRRVTLLQIMVFTAELGNVNKFLAISKQRRDGLFGT